MAVVVTVTAMMHATVDASAKGLLVQLSMDVVARSVAGEIAAGWAEEGMMEV